MKVTIRDSLYIRLLYQEQNKTIANITEKFPQYSRATIYRHAVRPLNDLNVDRRRQNPGRPRRVSIQDERQIVRHVERLRNDLGSFTVKKLRLEAGVTHVSIHTVRRVLKKNKYHYLQSRKKGLLTPKDRLLRLRFAKTTIKEKPRNFWTDHVAMYLDGTSFAYKGNPHDQARSPRSMAWRKRSEGLALNCTSKGKKTGTGGKTAAFMVGIAYDAGVVLCEQYHDRLNGKKFGDLARRHFPGAFENFHTDSKVFLQDGCPIQNSAEAKKAFKEIGAEIFSIPARSPDVNPIENFFGMVDRELTQEALHKVITRETFQEFSDRVKRTMKRIPVEYINNTIKSMNKRLEDIVKSKGLRIKY